ncbi:MAG: TRAP transporter substrate-binding protein DctP [Geminicoccaceae bacterium]
MGTWQTGFVAGALGVGALIGGTGFAEAETKLRFATYVNEIDIRYKGFEYFAEQVRERTGGEVVIEIFGSGTLHPFTKGIDSVLGGVSDISPLSAGGIDNRLPCAYVTNFMPVPVDWERHAELDQEYNALLRDELANLGLVVVLSSNFSYDQEWWFHTPVEHLDQLDGKLVRSVGPVVTQIIEKWGGEPVFIDPKEVYQSAERGVVDGINMGVATYSSWQLWGVMPHMINAGLFYGNVMYAMSKDKFDALSPEHQEAIMAAGVDAARWIKPQYEAWINEQVGLAVMKGGGSARALDPDERLRLIESAAEGWNDQMDEACGPELAAKLRALFSKYAG